MQLRRYTVLSLLIGVALASPDFGLFFGRGILATPAAAATRSQKASRAKTVRVARVSANEAARARQARLQQSRRQMMLPSRGAITSRFGPRRMGSHHGVDLRAPVGTPVKSSMGGTVSFAGWKNSIYGNMVAVKHPNGLVTRYAHLSRVTVRPGQKVAQGQVVARSGNTGRSTGPHIHFEVLKNGRAINPLTVAR